jgi:serine/threonine protein kinase
LEKDSEFTAPELIAGKPSEKSDVYSLGKVLDLMLKNSNELSKNMCIKNENQRYSLEQVAQHPWLNDNFVVTIRCLENILNSG